ncbi:unnamed protein product [Moneuplotes crassus]|uniref:Uncharacterized protein n=1 Tax=Euplotes crassus TaxID=5936 RepID=A0AAD1UQ49_EUPCR|nr:unnamed protein product [Moneuplotes crassus]
MSKYDKQQKMIQVFNKATDNKDSKKAMEFLVGSKWNVKKAIECYHLYLRVGQRDKEGSILFHRHSEPINFGKTFTGKVKEPKVQEIPIRRPNSFKSLSLDNSKKSELESKIMNGLDTFVEDKKFIEEDFMIPQDDDDFEENLNKPKFKKVESSEVDDTDECGGAQAPIVSYKSLLHNTLTETNSKEETNKGELSPEYLFKNIFGKDEEDDDEESNRVTAFFGEVNQDKQA